MSKKKVLLVIIILLMLAASLRPADSVKAAIIYTPVSEVIDLKVDGSDASVTKSLTKTYDYITHITLRFSYNDTLFIGDEFGEGTALENGTCFLYQGADYFANPVKRNEQFYKFFEETTRFVDDKDPKHIHIIGHLEFEHIFGHPLRITALTDLQFKVQDDLTSSTYDIDAFKMVIQGNVISSLSGSKFITVEENVLRYNTPVDITFADLKDSHHYLVNWTADNSGIDFYTDGDGSDVSMRLSIIASNEYQTIYLRDGETEEIIDSITVFFINRNYYDMSDLFNNAPYIIVYLLVGLCLLGLPIYFLRRSKS